MEYESFHFLVHKQVDLPPNYVKAVPESPPTFEELWMASPESLKRKTLKKDEKLFWRSRQRLEFIIEEARGKGCIVVNVREVDTNTVYRPLVIDLRVLFPILDDKRALEKDRSVKKGTGIDDAQLGRAACDYLLARLKPSDGAQPLPPWFQRGASGDLGGEEGSTVNATSTAGLPYSATSTDSASDSSAAAAAVSVASAASTDASTGAEAAGSDATATTFPAAPGAVVLEECQAVVNCLSHDTWTTLERAPPPDLLEANEWVIAWRAKEAETAEAAAGAVKNDEAATASVGGDDTGEVAAAGGASASAGSAVEASSDAGKAAEEGMSNNEATKSKVGASATTGSAGAAAAKGASSGGKAADAPTTSAAGSASKPKGNKVSPAPASAPKSQAKERLQKSGRAVANAAAATKKGSRVAPSNGK